MKKCDDVRFFNFLSVYDRLSGLSKLTRLPGQTTGWKACHTLVSAAFSALAASAEAPAACTFRQASLVAVPLGSCRPLLERRLFRRTLRRCPRQRPRSRASGSPAEQCRQTIHRSGVEKQVLHT